VGVAEVEAVVLVLFLVEMAVVQVNPQSKPLYRLQEDMPFLSPLVQEEVPEPLATTLGSQGGILFSLTLLHLLHYLHLMEAQVVAQAAQVPLLNRRITPWGQAIRQEDRASLYPYQAQITKALEGPVLVVYLVVEVLCQSESAQGLLKMVLDTVAAEVAEVVTLLAVTVPPAS
jgi:hypothetical protein